MSTNLVTKMSPEGLEIANAYLEKGTIPAVCAELGVSENEVSEVLNKREIKQYIDTVFLDTGYRNRFKISETLDMLIEKKLEEADETEIYTTKDMADLLQMAHKMRIEELKAQTEMDFMSSMKFSPLIMFVVIPTIVQASCLLMMGASMYLASVLF